MGRAMNIEIEVNGRTILAKRGMTILEVLKANGVYIPTLCFLDDYRPSGACRICVVEVDGRKDLVPACSFPVEEWMRIQTHSPRVIRARRTILKLLLAKHPNDCLYCTDRDHCGLHELINEIGIVERSHLDQVREFKLDNTSPALQFDQSKCVLCSRCVNLCEKEQYVAALDFMNRGNMTSVGTLMERGLNFSSCIHCGQCIQVCPTGALQESDSLPGMMDAISDRERCHIAVIDPAVLASVNELSGLRVFKDGMMQITGALKRIGYNKVYEGLWAPALEAWYLGKYLEKRSKDWNHPLLLGSCPAITQLVHQQLPAFSECLSPVLPGRYLLARWIREKYPSAHITWFTPCTALKRETAIGTHQELPYRIDSVLSVRELGRLVRIFGLRLDEIDPEVPDTPNLHLLPNGSLAGVAGGFMELFVNGYGKAIRINVPDKKDLARLRGLKSHKRISLRQRERPVEIEVASGVSELVNRLNGMAEPDQTIHLIEAMACRFGCINGGGNPHTMNDKAMKNRMKLLYTQADRLINTPVLIEPDTKAIPDWSVEEVTRDA